jgi:hypothetical protein
MRLGISEIFELVAKEPSKQGKIDLLRKHYTPSLAQFVRAALDPVFVWDLPPGNPPYKQNPYPAQENNLQQELRRFYLFFKDGNTNLTSVRREALFIQLLESLSPKDAELVLAAKDKKIPYKGLTVKLFNEAYPNLIQEDKGGKDVP